MLFNILMRKSLRPFKIQKRTNMCGGEGAEGQGLVLGVYNASDDPYRTYKKYTVAAEEYDKQTDYKLSEYLRLSGPIPAKCETRVFYGLDKKFSAVVVVGLGDECVSYNETEQMDEYKEAVREAAASGARKLQEMDFRTVYVESFGNAESAAEGAAMGVWIFQDLKGQQHQKLIPKLLLHEDCDYTGWQIGLQKAAAQNLARQLCETPANLLTPIAFAQRAVEVLCKAGINVEVKVRNWAKIMKMEAFLAAAKGSCEPPIFLEVSYYGCEPEIAPVTLIGKGVTFDSGGLCLKNCEEMKHMRGDMAGAAVVVAAARAVSALQLPINLRGLIPLCENLPGTCSMKPGDILKAKNGKSILVEDTDFDGRLCLADAMAYSMIYNPRFILDVGTLCREMESGLGDAATGAFSNNDSLYEQMRVAGVHTGDRVWRMPLWDHYTQKVTRHPGVDVTESYRSTGAPCSCAAFLREFLPNCDWIHLDTYGVMRSDGKDKSYLRRGMSGRPTRTIIEFLAQLACIPIESEQCEAEK